VQRRADSGELRQDEVEEGDPGQDEDAEEHELAAREGHARHLLISASHLLPHERRLPLLSPICLLPHRPALTSL
jgi:hypothetical protein